jgi:hypothetical protein
MDVRTAALAALMATCNPAWAIPEGPEPNTPAWFEREAMNHGRVLQAAQEQLNADFQLRWNQQSTTNRQDWIDRALADPSWVGYPSGNSPNTPAGAMWSSVSVSDPTRYPEAEGPNGRAFYETEAEVQTLVFYDNGCARITAKVWAPRSWQAGDAPLPGVVIQNGSIQASQTMYWWAAQALVRAGYVVMTFDPRGQGRSDLQTPVFEQGGNINSDVFFDGMADAIDFFRSGLMTPYGHNLDCAGTYPTEVAPHNPFYERLDLERLGIAGHSLGASGISSVQGYPADRFQFPDAAGQNPVDVLVAWDALGANEEFPPRVPAMGQSAEYFAGAPPFTSPPEPEADKGAFKAYQSRGLPAYQFTIAGSTHFEWSLIPGFPTTSWCADISSGSCSGGWGNPMAEHYTVAWMDRWLKKPGEPGYDDADARLLDDAQFCERLSVYLRSARSFARRDGVVVLSEDLRADCVAAGHDQPFAAPAARAQRFGGGAASGLLLLMLALSACHRLVGIRR